jgi:hypothetical protein
VQTDLEALSVSVSAPAAQECHGNNDLAEMIQRTMARMINEGFMGTASKEDIKELRTEMQAGFDRIENLLLAKQEQRLNELEARMKTLEDALAVSPHTKSRQGKAACVSAASASPPSLLARVRDGDTRRDPPCQASAFLNVSMTSITGMVSSAGSRETSSHPPRSMRSISFRT